MLKKYAILLLFSMHLSCIHSTEIPQKNIFEKVYEFVKQTPATLWLWGKTAVCFGIGLGCYTIWKKQKKTAPESATPTQEPTKPSESSNNISFLSILAEGRLPGSKTKYPKEDISLFRETIQKDEPLGAKQSSKQELNPQYKPAPLLNEPNLFYIGPLYNHIFNLSKKINFSMERPLLHNLYKRMIYDLWQKNQGEFLKLTIKNKAPLKFLNPGINYFFNNLFQNVVIMHNIITNTNNSIRAATQISLRPELKTFELVENELSSPTINITPEEYGIDKTIFLDYKTINTIIDDINVISPLSNKLYLEKEIQKIKSIISLKLSSEYLTLYSPINYCLFINYKPKIDAISIDIQNAVDNLFSLTFLTAQKSTEELKKENKTLGQHLFENFDKGLKNLDLVGVKRDEVYETLGLKTAKRKKYTIKDINEAFTRKTEEVKKSTELSEQEKNILLHSKIRQAHVTIKSINSKKAYDAWLTDNKPEKKYETFNMIGHTKESAEISEFTQEKLTDLITKFLEINNTLKTLFTGSIVNLNNQAVKKTFDEKVIETNKANLTIINDEFKEKQLRLYAAMPFAQK